MDSVSIHPRRWAMFALLALPLGLAGCGDPAPPAGALRPVKGKVVFSKPEALSGLKIEFLNKLGSTGRPASGDIGPDGTFSLKSADGEGAHEGEYSVRLAKPGGFPKGKYNLPIPQPYFDEDGAYLSATVKSDTTELPPFDLQPIAGAAAKRR